MPFLIRHMFVLLSLTLAACGDDPETEEKSIPNTVDNAWITESLAVVKACEASIQTHPFLESVDALLEKYEADIAAGQNEIPFRGTAFITIGENGRIRRQLDHVQIDMGSFHFSSGTREDITDASFSNDGEKFTIEDTISNHQRVQARCESDAGKYVFDSKVDEDEFTLPVVADTGRQITIGAHIMPTLMEAQSPRGGFIVQHCEVTVIKGVDAELCRTVTVKTSAIDQVIPSVAKRASMLDFRKWSTARLDALMGR